MNEPNLRASMILPSNSGRNAGIKVIGAPTMQILRFSVQKPVRRATRGRSKECLLHPFIANIPASAQHDKVDENRTTTPAVLQ
jgi:hypothetical protein